ncbi:MAG: hypothetical protein M1830_005088, partial [Pleopsidium flavum]
MVAELASNRMTPPISYTQLRQITKEACESTFESEESYEHWRAESWNTNIINTILHSLISSNPLYKYAVNSTIIQHRAPPPLQKTLNPTHNMSSTSTTIGANKATAHDETLPVTGGMGDERPGWSVEGPEGGVQGSGGRSK